MWVMTAPNAIMRITSLKAMNRKALSLTASANRICVGLLPLVCAAAAGVKVVPSG